MSFVNKQKCQGYAVFQCKTDAEAFAKMKAAGGYVAKVVEVDETPKTPKKPNAKAKEPKCHANAPKAPAKWVFYADRGNCFHRESCQYVKKSKHRTERLRAVLDYDLTPCSVCKP